MALKKEDFTDEQWTEIQAETDRARTAASATARKNAEKDAETALADKVHEAVEAERARIEATDNERLELDRKAVEAEKAQVAADRKSLKATKKLLGAGFDEAEAESLLPMFINVDDKSFEQTIDAFVKANEARVKAQVDSVKQELLGNATPPADGSGAPVDNQAKVNEALKAGDEVGALDLILTGTAPTTK